MKPSPFQPGQRVEVWFEGWDQWVAGEVVRVGFIGGVPCALVQLGGVGKPSVHRFDQMQAEAGLFGMVSEETKT